jgi:iron(III) transport system ATP-binding protein
MTERTAPQPWLHLDDVSIAYGQHTAVRQLSLSLAPGRIGCLLGPSGCGKTTVLRAIAGFEPLLGGEIRLDGERVSAPGHLVPPERRRIGMVFQDHALFPHLTVARNVAFGLRGLPAEAVRARVDEMLATMGLQHAAERFPHELSGGQQQRVALARALAPRPAILVADEPTGNLDEATGRDIVDLLFALKRDRGTTLLLVTHDLGLAERCDRIVRLRAGKIVEERSPQAVG